MKRLEEAKLLKEQISEESRQATLDTMIAQQIAALEKLFETNAAHVKDPLAYNMVAGLIDQIKAWAPSPFILPERNLDIQKGYEGQRWSTEPLFGKP